MASLFSSAGLLYVYCNGYEENGMLFTLIDEIGEQNRKKGGGEEGLHRVVLRIREHFGHLR